MEKETKQNSFKEITDIILNNGTLMETLITTIRVLNSKEQIDICKLILWKFFKPFYGGSNADIKKVCKLNKELIELTNINPNDINKVYKAMYKELK